ncbi:RNA-directed DNA polymerase, eukaryota [Artemisia annua]|uniref:RNA-directed DNA polymerase, eukaryota n=1 Tax=Artemisia annua TaxID=35608 RepID=A0A2U1L5M8_ARTAN|nr:RNA-directed DNA polymerase, eukaryota [Artemisia annua]
MGKKRSEYKERWLGIGSIFGLNIGLLFKWIWRFRTRPTDLWACVIGSIYGHDGGIPHYSSRWQKHSNWGIIVSSIKRLNDKGVDMLSLCTRKLGNEESTHFWENSWSEINPLRSQFPRIYLLEIDKNCLIANRVPLRPFEWCSVLRRHPRGGVESSQFDALNAIIGNVQLMDNCDYWQWFPNVVAGYTVASGHALVDDSILGRILWLPDGIAIFLLRSMCLSGD